MPWLQAETEQAQTPVDRRGKAIPKRKGPQHPMVARMLSECEDYLGHYLMSRLRGRPLFKPL